MTAISMTGVTTFNPHELPSEITLESAPIKMDGLAKAPDGALTMYYGFDALKDVSTAIREAEARNMRLLSVNVKVDTGDSIIPEGGSGVPRFMVSPETLPNARFLSFARINKALERHVVEIWDRLLMQDPQLANAEIPDNYYKHQNFLVMHPQLLTKLHEHPDFSNVDVMVYPVRAGGKIRQKATLFSTEHVISATVQGHPEIKVNLPDLSRKISSDVDKSVRKSPAPKI